MTSVPSLLRGVLRQSGETSLQRIGVEEGGGAGVLGGHVLLLSHVALGTAAGEWQAGEENTTHRDLWVWGLGEQNGCGAGASSPGFIKGKK